MINKKKTVVIFLAAVIIVSVIYINIPDVSTRLDNYGQIVYDRDGRILRAFLNSNQQWCFEPQQRVPENLKQCVLHYEDKYFYIHPGFNPASIASAAISNLKAGSIVRGGSTLSMQVSRIAVPGARTFGKKIIELLEAVKLEIKYSKEEILQFYLANAPYGSNIVGVRAASLKYFEHEPEELSYAEAALLAVLPNAPGIMRPGDNQKQLIKKRNKLLKSMYEAGEIEENTCIMACSEPAPAAIRNLDFCAPHFTRMVQMQSKAASIKTTIDKDQQQLVETVIDFNFAELRDQGVKNVALLVVENKSREILAWVGSQDFFEADCQGMINGVIAKRSPGSTFKPFLYGLAMDEGLITIQTRLQDVPTYYQNFEPENYGRSYSGWVQARDALTKSLNIPAVRLLNSYGVGRFYNFLEDAGISTLFREPQGYGLTLVIGGCEVKMLELAALYVSLANYGRFSEIKYLENMELCRGKQLLSEGSAWQILNTLCELERPGAEYYWQQYDNQIKIAWKTGTSFGHRDAWAVGVSTNYTVAVWCGNFDNESNQALSGAAAAAPLMFSVFNVLPQKEGGWFDMPSQGLKERVICAETGLAPSRWCPRDTVLVSSQARELGLCNYHQPFEVTNDGNNTVCSLCWDNIPHHTEVYLLYPPQVKKYLQKSGYRLINVPPHLPDCPSVDKEKVQIEYPREGAKIFLPKDLDSEQQKLSPQLSGCRDKERLFWYLDDEFVGESTGRENLPLLPESGQHTLSVIDASGNCASVSFWIIRSDHPGK